LLLIHSISFVGVALVPQFFFLGFLQQSSRVWGRPLQPRFIDRQSDLPAAVLPPLFMPLPSYLQVLLRDGATYKESPAATLAGDIAKSISSYKMPSLVSSLQSVAKAAVAYSQLVAVLPETPVHAVSPPVCTNPQLSCQASNVRDTCCVNAPGGLLLLTQFWDTTPVTGPVDSWTVHGLW
jgi:hypothetical protein